MGKKSQLAQEEIDEQGTSCLSIPRCAYCNVTTDRGDYECLPTPSPSTTKEGGKKEERKKKQETGNRVKAQTQLHALSCRKKKKKRGGRGIKKKSKKRQANV